MRLINKFDDGKTGKGKERKEAGWDI